MSIEQHTGDYALSKEDRGSFVLPRGHRTFMLTFERFAAKAPRPDRAELIEESRRANRMLLEKVKGFLRQNRLESEVSWGPTGFNAFPVIAIHCTHRVSERLKELSGLESIRDTTEDLGLRHGRRVASSLSVSE